MKKVVVSGIGSVTPAGIGVATLWNSMKSGISHVHRIRSFDPSPYATQIAAEITSFDPYDFLPPKLVKRTGRATQLGCAAALQAMDDGGHDLSRMDRSRVGIFVGVSSPQLDVAEVAYTSLMEGGFQKLPPSSLGAFFPNATAGALSSLLGITGPTITISTGCSAGSNAVGQALNLLNMGEIDYALVVGTDSLITQFGFASFNALRNMSTRNDSPHAACMPFDLNRDGFVLGEGAGALILESLHTASERYGKAYCYVRGYGCTSSADDLISTNVNNDALSRAITVALDKSGIGPTSIDAINAHGCGSRTVDQFEARNIEIVFGAASCAPPVFTIKPLIGHPLAAAGPLQVISTVMAFQNKYIPPVLNFSHPDPLCPVNVLTETPLPLDAHSIVLLNDCGYGGNNVTLILKNSANSLI
jgi:3-oxoacyl-[acyl-carrier-protein] synthase II